MTSALCLRLQHAEELFLDALGGDGDMVAFEREWSSIQQDVEHAVQNGTIDTDTERNAGIISHRISIIANSFVELEEECDKLTQSFMAEINNVLDGAPTPSKSPRRDITPAAKWIVANKHNLYPSPTVRDEISQQAEWPRKDLDAWFTDARQKIGWTSIRRNHFGGKRTDVVKAATSFFVGAGVGLSDPVRLAFTEMEARINEYYAERCIKTRRERDSISLVKGQSPDRLVSYSESAPLTPHGRLHTAYPTPRTTPNPQDTQTESPPVDLTFKCNPRKRNRSLGHDEDMSTWCPSLKRSRLADSSLPPFDSPTIFPSSSDPILPLAFSLGDSDHTAASTLAKISPRNCDSLPYARPQCHMSEGTNNPQPMSDVFLLSSKRQIDAASHDCSTPNGHQMDLFLGEQNSPSISTKLPYPSAKVLYAAGSHSGSPVTLHLAAQPSLSLTSHGTSRVPSSVAQGEFPNISPEVPEPVTCERLGTTQSIDFTFCSSSQTFQTYPVAAIDTGCSSAAGSDQPFHSTATDVDPWADRPSDGIPDVDQLLGLLDLPRDNPSIQSDPVLVLDDVDSMFNSFFDFGPGPLSLESQADNLHTSHLTGTFNVHSLHAEVVNPKLEQLLRRRDQVQEYLKTIDFQIAGTLAAA